MVTVFITNETTKAAALIIVFSTSRAFGDTYDRIDMVSRMMLRLFPRWSGSSVMSGTTVATTPYKRQSVVVVRVARSSAPASYRRSALASTLDPHSASPPETLRSLRL
ncbi:hypothetical protein ABIE89_005781 [Bradyrhizobium niftali]